MNLSRELDIVLEDVFLSYSKFANDVISEISNKRKINFPLPSRMLTEKNML